MMDIVIWPELIIWAANMAFISVSIGSMVSVFWLTIAALGRSSELKELEHKQKMALLQAKQSAQLKAIAAAYEVE